MKKNFLVCILITIIAGCGDVNPDQQNDDFWVDVSLQKFEVNTSIRAIEVISETEVYYAGAAGRFGYTTDGGQSWTHDSIAVEDNYPEFRSIAVADGAIHILSVGSPAYLLRSADMGETWDIVYTETGESVFYDAMKFLDNKEGIAMGDPVGGCISLIKTEDGGLSWNKLSCDQIPEVREGEAAFAASNTNIDAENDHIWIGTGGGAARIFHSADRGKSWNTFETPISQGGTMTGIFSIDFYDENRGLIFGGDWEDKTNSSGNAALTNDGGKSWELISENWGPGYRSCIQFFPGGGGKSVMAVGIPGIAYSPDLGDHWQLISDEDYYTLRFAPAGNVAWLAGNGKIARMEIY